MLDGRGGVRGTNINECGTNEGTNDNESEWMAINEDDLKL